MSRWVVRFWGTNTCKLAGGLLLQYLIAIPDNADIVEGINITLMKENRKLDPSESKSDPSEAAPK